MPKELSVTYRAPKGDNKVVEMIGHTFYDGKAETVVVDDRTLAMLKGNKYFECGEAKDPKPDEHASKETHKGR